MNQSPNHLITQSPNSPITQRQGCARWLGREGRLRSGWRIALYLIAALLMKIIGAIVLGVVLAMMLGVALAQQGVPPLEIAYRIESLFHNLFDYPLLALGTQAEQMLLALAVIWIFRRWIDRRPFRALGFQLSPGWWREALAGFALVVVAWGVIFALSLGLGAVTIVGFGWDGKNWGAILGALALGLVFNVMVGITEEADARGYVLQNLAEGIRFGPAAVVSSVYFGVLHLLNPGAGAASTLGIFSAGLLLAMGYYATGRLWFSIGMHAGWNFAQGPIFGFLVSGLNMGGLFHLRVTGPEWLLGGAFGPEAGALAVGVEVVMIGLLFVWARRNVRHET